MSRKACVITGASRGIGFATALRFARRGYALVGAARQEADLAAAVKKIRATGVICEAVIADVGDVRDARRIVDLAVQRFGRVDVLVNNAGVAPLAPVDEFDPAEFERVCRVNMAAVFHTTQAVWPTMRAQGGGVIVKISSLDSIDPLPGFGAYGASKAWVNLVSQATAVEGKAVGIRVFAIGPGAVEMQMMPSVFPEFRKDQTLHPGDVAAVIVSVCDESMAHCSG